VLALQDHQRRGGAVTQTRAGSAVEASVSTAIGFGVAWAATFVVLPAFGAPVSAASSLGITCVFTAISLVRQYAVRRLFVWLAAPRVRFWLRRSLRGW
jgi:hypothetical protein